MKKDTIQQSNNGQILVAREDARHNEDAQLKKEDTLGKSLIKKKKELSPEKKRVMKDFLFKLVSDPEASPESNKLDQYVALGDTENETTEQKEKRFSLLRDLMSTFGLESGSLATNLSHDPHHGTLHHIRQKVVKEHDCSNALELMLADRITASYWRAMRLDMRFNRYIEEKDGSMRSFNQVGVNLLKELNRSIDLADRHLGNDILLLRQLKQPQLSIKLKADNMYFANNQQINNEKPSEKLLVTDDLGKTDAR